MCHNASEMCVHSSGCTPHAQQTLRPPLEDLGLHVSYKDSDLSDLREIAIITYEARFLDVQFRMSLVSDPSVNQTRSFRSSLTGPAQHPQIELIVQPGWLEADGCFHGKLHALPPRLEIVLFFLDQCA